MATKRRDAGAGSVFQRKDGKWVATIELGWERGKRRRKSIVRREKADVVAELRRVRAQLDSGGTVAVNIPTVERYLAEWLDTVAADRLKPVTLHSYRSEVDLHIVPFIGRIRLDKLTPRHIVDMHRKLREMPPATGRAKPGETLAESSVLKAHAVLSRALTDAVKIFRYISDNPAQSVDRPGSTGKAERRELTVDEALKVLKAVTDDPLGSRWAAALMLGARQGELLGLEWDRVDLDGGVIDLSWQLQSIPYRTIDGEKRLAFPPGLEHRQLYGALHLTRPKSNRPRVIPIPAYLLAWLRRRRDETDHDLVWSRPGGLPLSPRADHDAWKDVLSRSGVESVPLHSARHTTASLLLALGVPEPVIMQILGHSVVATTRRYAHVDLALARSAMEKLGEALALPNASDSSP